MNTHYKVLVGAGIIALTTVGGFFAYLAHAGTTDIGGRRAALIERLAELSVTADQKAQVKQILRKYQPTAGPLIREVVDERRSLRGTIRAENIDETAIRAQAATLASLEADLAVTRAHVVHEVRAVLTPEQIEKLKGMQIDFDARVDGFLGHVAKRIAED